MALRTLEAGGLDLNAFVAKPEVARFARIFDEPIEGVAVATVLDLALELWEHVRRFGPEALREAQFADVLVELLGPDRTRQWNLIGPSAEPLSVTHSGLADGHRAESDHVFHSISGKMPGQFVVYWVWVRGDEKKTPFVSHHSIELFVNPSALRVQLQYAIEILGERGFEALKSLDIEPRSYLLFDGRAPHRHICMDPDSKAKCLVVQFSERLLFSNTVAFAPPPPHQETMSGKGEVPLSFGLPPRPPRLNEVLGPRLRAFREASGRSGEEIVSFMQNSEARRASTRKSSARVRISEVESGKKALTLGRLLPWAAALDIRLRDLICFPDDIILGQSSLEVREETKSLISPQSYFFASSPTALYDARITPVHGMAYGEHGFVAVPGEALVFGLDTDVELTVVCSPLHFRAHAGPPADGDDGWLRWPEGSVDENDNAERVPVKANEAALFRGDLPHRIRPLSSRGGLLLIGTRRLLDLHAPLQPRTAGGSGSLDPRDAIRAPHTSGRRGRK